jgi:hypothetical protein
LASESSATVEVRALIVAPVGSLLTIAGQISGLVLDPVTDDNIASDSVVVTSSVTPPTISAVNAISKPGSEFKMKVVGSSYQDGVLVFIGSDSAAWSQVRLKHQGLLTLKGGSALKRRFRKGVPVSIRLVNPDGGSTETTFTR